MQAKAEGALLLLQYAASFPGEFRVVSTPVKKDNSVVAKIWFKYCVKSLGTARTVEPTPRKGKK